MNRLKEVRVKAEAEVTHPPVFIVIYLRLLYCWSLLYNKFLAKFLLKVFQPDLTTVRPPDPSLNGSSDSRKRAPKYLLFAACPNQASCSCSLQCSVREVAGVLLGETRDPTNYFSDCIYNQHEHFPGMQPPTPPALLPDKYKGTPFKWMHRQLSPAIEEDIDNMTTELPLSLQT